MTSGQIPSWQRRDRRAGRVVALFLLGPFVAMAASLIFGRLGAIVAGSALAIAMAAGVLWWLAILCGSARSALHAAGGGAIVGIVGIVGAALTGYVGDNEAWAMLLGSAVIGAALHPIGALLAAKGWDRI